MTTKTIRLAQILALSLLAFTPLASWGSGTCTAARFHNWRDTGCHMTPGLAGAPPSGADNSGGNQASCPICPTGDGQPRWWVDEPYVNLWITDQPLSYTMSSGTPLTFRWIYKQRYQLPMFDECPNFYRYTGSFTQRNDQYTDFMFNYGMTNAAWNHNWNTEVMFWDAIWENLMPSLQASTPIYKSGYEALVFRPEGGIYYLGTNQYSTNFYVSTGLSDPQSRAGLQPMSSLGYPTLGQTQPDPNGIYWGTPQTNGFRLVYPDGSQDQFCLTFKSFLGTSAHAFLTQRIDPHGRVTQLGYEFIPQTNNYSLGYSAFRLRYLVDPDGRTNTFLYLTNSPKNSWQVTEIDDPFGRKAQFSYGTSGITNGLLTAITDAANNTSYFGYHSTNGYITNLATPYGSTGFRFYDFCDDSTVTNGVTQRAVLVSEPLSAHQLFYYNHTNSLIPATATPPSILGQSFDSGSSGANHPGLGYRNTYHWDRRQYDALSATVLANLPSSIPVGIQNLTSNDYFKASMKHWLWQADGVSISGSVSSECAPSQDSGGSAQGVRTWYNYPNQLIEVTTEGDAQPACIARILPDGSPQYMLYDYYTFPNNLVGLVSDNESSYTKSDGTVGLRTNWFTYASNGIDLTAITNSGGQWTNFAYNSNHQVTFTTNALNQVTSLIYEDVYTHNLQSLTLPSGEVLSFNYYPPTVLPLHPFDLNKTDFLQSLTLSAEGRTITINEYANALPKSVAVSGTGLPTLNMTNFWDGLNRLTGTAFDDTTTVSNLYDRLYLSGTKDRIGFWTYYGYDALEHITSITDAKSNVTTLAWCDCGSLTTITDPLTNTTSFYYNNQGLLTGTAFPDGSSSTNFYDSVGRITSTLDGLNRGVTYGYNNQGLVTGVTNAYGPAWQVLYDLLNRPQTATDANNVTVNFTFDLLDRILTRTWPTGGGSEGFLWSTNGLLAYTNQNQNLTWFLRDGAGRINSVTNANKEVTQFTYDALNHVMTIIDGLTHTTATFYYNQYGWLTNKLDGLGHQILGLTYNPDGQATNRWTPQFGNTVYAYDPVGNLTNINYGSTSVAYAWDAANQLKTMADALGTTTFGFTQVGQLQSEAGPWANSTLTYGYSQGHRSSANLNSPSPFNLSYGYDSAWRLQTLTAPSGSFGYGYGTGASAAASLVRSITLPNSAWITNHFDGLDRMDYTGLFNRWGFPVDAYSYVYDALGLRKTITRDLGLATNTVYANYDLIGQVTNWTAQEVGGTPRLNEQLGWAYDKAGNLHYLTNGALLETYTVDSLNQISTIGRSGNLTLGGATPAPATSVASTGLPAQTYADLTFARTNLSLVNGLNTFSNFAQNTYGAKATNIVSANLPTTVTLLYDSNGNLTNDGTRSFAYDAENRLITNWVASAWKSEFVYDGLGRRRIERDYGWQSGAWSKTNEIRYVYDGWLIVQERDANNNVLVNYTRGLDMSGGYQDAGGIGGLLARTDSSGTAFYHADGQGNITALIDGQQNVTARYLYNPFGREIGQWGASADINRIQFSSMPRHANSGLSLYRFRAYDPSLQRWVNRDPLGEFGGANLYQFVLNCPTAYLDPLGLDWQRDLVINSWTAAGTGLGAVGGFIGGGGAGAIAGLGVGDAVTIPAGAVAGAAAGAAGGGAAGNAIGTFFANALGLPDGPGGGNQRGAGGKGWRGDKNWKDLVKQCKKGGDVKLGKNNIPTADEAKDILREAGAKVQRIEEHAPGGVSQHTYPHINFETADGIKGTIRIQAVPPSP